MSQVSDVIIPRALVPGDRVAIISPATTVREEYVDGAAAFLRGEGFEPVVMPHAKGPADGSYASSFRGRLSDFLDAWNDPGIAALLCARGGYGTAHLLPYISPETLRANPNWLVGFSDISAFHALLGAAGVASIHGPMARHLCECPGNRATRALLALLRGAPMCHDNISTPHPLNVPGVAEGVLTGGNLAVLDGLAGTPFDLLDVPSHRDAILFVEDIAEKIYKVERMLLRLRMSGVLHRVRGLVVGQFTEYTADANHSDMYGMIDALLRHAGIRGIPVVYGFPVGHVDDNLPLVENVPVRLTVTDGRTSLRAIY